MYHMMNAHPLTFVIILASIMVTPFFVLATYAFSGASLRKGTLIGSVFLIWGGFMGWVCIAEIPKSLGPLGALIIPVCWVTPSLVLLGARRWFLEKPLSQYILILLQLWRVIGALFLLEMTRGHIPGIFAYPAGVGDITTALLAAMVLFKYRKNRIIPDQVVLIVIVCGVTDLLSAFFFGFLSSEGPQQIFFSTVINNTLQFPTGMIPLFLVPYALFFHTLSYLTLRQKKRLMK